jgi:hypothetical protein
MKEIEKDIWGPLRDGTERGCVVGITSLVGTHQSPGPLHCTRNPRVVIVTPWRSDTHHTRRELRHTKAVKVLRKGLESFFAGYISEVGYHATDEMRSHEVGFLGRAVVEFDMAKPGVHTDHNGWGWQRGRWRVWVEDKIVARHEFNVDPLAAPLHSDSNAQSQPELSRLCWCVLQPQLHPQHHEFDEQIRVLRQTEADGDMKEDRKRDNNRCRVSWHSSKA